MGRCCVGFWFLVLVFIQTSSAPSDIFLPLDELENVRAKLRRLWIIFLTRQEFAFKPVATGTQLRSVVFYKMHDGIGRSLEPRQSICFDRQPPKGTSVDTCDKQRNAGYCKARFFGIIKDGLCARACGLCAIQHLGMRATFAFVNDKIPINGHGVHKVLVTLEMQPNGQWRYYNTHNDAFGVGVHCRANRVLPHTVDRQVRM